MPLLPDTALNGSLGVLMPPKPPGAPGSTVVATPDPTYGTTEWVLRWCAGADAAGASG